MRAIVCERYGPPDVLQLKEVDKPVVRDLDVLVRVMATTVSAGDCELRGFQFPLLLGLMARIGFGLRGPRRKILGQELSGEVEAVGKDVRRFRPGDRIIAATGFALGAYAEFACMPEDGAIAPCPSNMSFEEAAAVPIGGLNALHFLRKAGIKGGQKVLINGAGGSIGTIAVQIAKSLGAEVTAVDSYGKLDMLRSLGADEVIDYREEDFTKRGEGYDIIFDVVGKATFPECIRSLVPGGVYLLGNSSLSRSLRGRWTARRSGKVFVGGGASYRAEDLLLLKGLIEEGKVRTAIDRSFPLEKMVEAHQYVENGHKRGNVVITVAHDGESGLGAD